jgi:serine/threonine protein kinase
MSPELHARAVEIFTQAIEIEDDVERRRWVDSACDRDPDLRHRVLAMLAADAEPGLSEPALNVAVNLVADQIEAAPDRRNARLGPYLLGAEIGAGGMGTVYEALDTRLDRKVAIKILPPHFISDPERVQRFRQEARAASLLNHPNIVSIYDAEFNQECDYITTEFIDGQTLRRMLSAGPLELGRVIEIAIQVCSALIAAHQAGIIHRDIKPENVMVRPDGIVKVLDFGLAKLTEISGAPLLQTTTGVFAGTGPYVSPEQLNGQVATFQSDLFSVGVLLYELATGTRPFTGATPVAVGSAILHQEPAPPSSITPSLGAGFDAVVLRALEKDPELRYQTAADLRAGLRFLARDPSRPAAPLPKLPPPRSKVRSLAWALGAGSALTAVTAGAAWVAFRPIASPLPFRFERLTEAPGEQISANLTPDGRQVIYASSERGKWDIYLQRVGGKTATNLTLGSALDDREPALSPDGTKIAFRSERDGGGLFVMEATGENPVRIAAQGHLPAWSPDGKSVVYSDDTFITPNIRSAPTSRLHVLDLITGRERPLPTGDAVQPSWSPHGWRIAYWEINAGGQRDLETVGLDPGSRPVPVTRDPFLDWNPVWSRNGEYLYFISDRGGAMNFWRVRINERTGQLHGSPEPVTAPAGYVKSLDFSADGTRFVYSSSAARVNLYSIGFDPDRLETTGKPLAVDDAHNITNFSISPDGASIVYDTLVDSTEEIWIQKLDGSDRRRVVSDGFRNRMPRWSPSGREIMFYSNRGGGVFNEWTIHPDGSGLREWTAVRESGLLAAAWIDNKRVVASRANGDLLLLRAAEQAVVDPPPLPGATGLGPVTLSEKPKNGTILGYAYTHGIEEELIAFTYPPGKFAKIGVPGRTPEWLPGSKPRFLFLRDSACYLYDQDTHREKRLFSVAPSRLYMIQPALDGKRIWFTQTIRESHVWMGELK